MGYYAEYWSTLLKGPWATTIKERWEARKAINNLKASDKTLYKKLPELVEKEHKVTAALKEEDKVIKQLKISAAKGYALAFNVSTMDMKVLEAVNKLIAVWGMIHAKTRNLPTNDSMSQEIERLSRHYVELLHKAIKKAEDEEREEYKDIMIIVNESDKQDHSQFMQAMRLRFQTLESQSMLAKLAIRLDIRRERSFIARIEALTKRCERLLQETQLALRTPKLGGHTFKLIAELGSILKESNEDIQKAFYHAHLIKKRDFLLVLKVIMNTEVLKQLNRKWLIAHFMPGSPVKQKEIEIDKIEDSIAKDFHSIAQALRISLKGLRDLESKGTTA